VTLALSAPIDPKNGGTGATTAAGALANLGFGNLFYANNYNSLSAALSAANGSTLVITSPVAITTNTAIPSNTAINVVRGGAFQVSAGQTLTISGPFQAGLYPVFTGSGTVAFAKGSVTDIYARWWYPGSGPWDSALFAAVAACESAMVWCDLPPAVNTTGTLTIGSGSWLRPESWEGGIETAARYGTVWTHSPSNSGVDTIKTSGTENIRIQGIFFASTNSGGTYPESAIYLNGVLGCRLKGIGTANVYTVSAILASGLQDCTLDDFEISGRSTPATPAGIRFLGRESTPLVGSVSTTTDIRHLTMSGGTSVGVLFDGDACFGCNFYSPEIESVSQTAWNIGKGNTVDIYSPYVENVPSTDSAYGVFRIGQDYASAKYHTFVNIYGGEVYGTNSSNANSVMFDLGQYADKINVFGGQYGRVGTFQRNTANCTTCIMTINAASADITGGFGTVTYPINFSMGPGNRFNTETLSPQLAYPSIDAQQGLSANAPLYYNTPGQFYDSTDQGLLIWNNSLSIPQWVSLAAASGGQNVLTPNNSTKDETAAKIGSIPPSVSSGLTDNMMAIPAKIHAEISALSLALDNKCLSVLSPATCGASTSGTVRIAANATSLVVNTSKVMASSVILFSYNMASTGCIAGPTNIAMLLAPYTSAVTEGVSFTVTLPIAPLANGVCVQFVIV
jgi:hypothetical protein